MIYDKDKLDQHNREVLERNIQGSKDVIEAKQHEDEEKQKLDEQGEGSIARPPDVQDPRHGDQSVPPHQKNVPAGGSSGSEMNLGGGYKSEPKH